MATGDKKSALMQADVGAAGGVAGYDATNAALAAKQDVLTADAAYYVAANGSDDNDGLTSATPFATVAKALSMVPRNLGGHTLSVNVAAGTYALCAIASFYNGAVTISGAEASFAKVAVRGVRAACTIWLASVQYLPSLYDYGAGSAQLVEVTSSDNVTLRIDAYSGNSHSGVNVVGVLAYQNSSVGIYGASTTSLTFTNLTAMVDVRLGSVVNSFANFGGSGNTYAISAFAAIALLYYPIAAGAADILYGTTYGGRVFAGGQTAAPNY